jgi:hypothetical protein
MCVCISHTLVHARTFSLSLSLSHLKPCSCVITLCMISGVYVWYAHSKYTLTYPYALSPSHWPTHLTHPLHVCVAFCTSLRRSCFVNQLAGMQKCTLFTPSAQTAHCISATRTLCCPWGSSKRSRCRLSCTKNGLRPTHTSSHKTPLITMHCLGLRGYGVACASWAWSWVRWWCVW